MGARASGLEQKHVEEVGEGDQNICLSSPPFHAHLPLITVCHPVITDVLKKDNV